MASTVGPFRSASLSFNSKGQSTGVATVQFQKAADATKAYNKYNGRLIDGSAYCSFLSPSPSLPFLVGVA
jgi:THO complex subunit 4